MRRLLLVCAVGLAAIISGAIVFQSSPEANAQKNARLQWEYASVTHAYSFSPVKDKLNRIYGMAEICYVAQNGCRRSEIKYELDYGVFLQERAVEESTESRVAASRKAAQTAFQKALAQMGNEGWEIVSSPDLQFEFVNIDDYNKFDDKSVLFSSSDTKAVYFKRAK